MSLHRLRTGDAWAGGVARASLSCCLPAAPHRSPNCPPLSATARRSQGPAIVANVAVLAHVGAAYPAFSMIVSTRWRLGLTEQRKLARVPRLGCIGCAQQSQCLLSSLLHCSHTSLPSLPPGPAAGVPDTGRAVHPGAPQTCQNGQAVGEHVRLATRRLFMLTRAAMLLPQPFLLPQRKGLPRPVARRPWLARLLVRALFVGAVTFTAVGAERGSIGLFVI